VIRSYLRDGDLSLANKLLGYNYTIQGLHIQGQGIGSKQFVPTINIEVEDFLIPKDGIYITKTKINNIEYCSVSFIGHRVTTDGKYAIETHILDKNIDRLRSKIVEISFIKRVRDNKKFENYQSLKSEIENDIKISKKYFDL
jgi:riboflavin kinase/FMN adenylyltransferase